MILRNLSPRAAGSDPKSNPIVIALAASICPIFIVIAIYVYVRRRRLENPKYIPTSESSKTSRWGRFRSSPIKLRRLFATKKSTDSSPNCDEETSYSASTRTATTEAAEMATSTNSVNRNTSIRSIMTLPPYHPSPNPNERLIAREGERAGVDTVVEFPETAEEEETRRGEDMESLYQIRQARRQEINERNERRRQRQEAREQGDWARLEQLRLDAQRRARARAESTGSAGSSTTSLPPGSSRELMAEHAARASSRERRVSSVSYADLGLARHDGTRLRADSVESDHRPLLESAAGISGSISANNDSLQEAPRRTSRFHLPVFGGQHNRAASAESVMTTDSEIAAMTPQTSSADRSNSGTGSDDVAVRTPSASEPSPPISEDPPGYNDDEEESAMGPTDSPPDYTALQSQSGTGVPRLPSLRVGEPLLPAIEITRSTPLIGPGEIPGRLSR